MNIKKVLLVFFLKKNLLYVYKWYVIGYGFVIVIWWVDDWL